MKFLRFYDGSNVKFYRQGHSKQLVLLSWIQKRRILSEKNANKKHKKRHSSEKVKWSF